MEMNDGKKELFPCYIIMSRFLHPILAHRILGKPEEYIYRGKAGKKTNEKLSPTICRCALRFHAGLKPKLYVAVVSRGSGSKVA